jgi:hypothetical protein
MRYRAAISGQARNLSAKLQDDLNSYEPQQEDIIPQNFLTIVLIPIRVDQTIAAPPAVVAD